MLSFCHPRSQAVNKNYDEISITAVPTNEIISTIIASIAERLPKISNKYCVSFQASPATKTCDAVVALCTRNGYKYAPAKKHSPSLTRSY